jgi:rod shape-determining protein MreD
MPLQAIWLFIPGATVVLATLLAALPWGLPSQTRFLLPLLPYAAIHYWAVRRPALMPEWMAFVSGLATDVLTHGPLGFWSLVFLLGLALVHAVPPQEAWGAGGRWLHFAVTVLVLAVAQCVIAAMFFMSAIDWLPFASAAAWASVAYPLLALLFRPLDRLWPRSGHARFERGI